MPTWNQRSRFVAMAVALQVGGTGVFVQPSASTGLMPVASVTNSHEAQTATDNTATGTVWEAGTIYLGQTATVGGTFNLRGPGGATPPALNTWVPGLILQAGGWAEIRKAATSTAALLAGSSTTALKLANTESSVDDFLIGFPIQHASIGVGFQQTSLIQDYIGSTFTASLPETLGAAPAAGTNYTIPACLVYQLGTLNTAPLPLSMSVWRDKKRYDYVDWRPASIAFTFPVSNEANQNNPDMTFSGRANIVGVFDDVTPALPSSVLAVPVTRYRNGKFYLDRVKLGHQQNTFSVATTLGAASNANQFSGQDGYDILSGTRDITVDLNSMAVADFDLEGRVANQTVQPMFSTFGLGAGNNWGFITPNIALNPQTIGDRNGYYNLTGSAVTKDVDKAAALCLWWT